MPNLLRKPRKNAGPGPQAGPRTAMPTELTGTMPGSTSRQPMSGLSSSTSPGVGSSMQSQSSPSASSSQSGPFYPRDHMRHVIKDLVRMKVLGAPAMNSFDDLTDTLPERFYSNHGPEAFTFEYQVGPTQGLTVVCNIHVTPDGLLWPEIMNTSFSQRSPVASYGSGQMSTTTSSLRSPMQSQMPSTSHPMVSGGGVGSSSYGQKKKGFFSRS